MTEESDAVVIVVSEEVSEISLVVGGKIRQGLDAATLRKLLLNLFDVKNPLLPEEEESSS